MNDFRLLLEFDKSKRCQFDDNDRYKKSCDCVERHTWSAHTRYTVRIHLLLFFSNNFFRMTNVEHEMMKSHFGVFLASTTIVLIACVIPHYRNTRHAKIGNRMKYEKPVNNTTKKVRKKINETRLLSSWTFFSFSVLQKLRDFCF